jgi:hypothetical protein
MFQVLIATTEDTVEIELISEESPGVPCCVTEGLATTDELPLSRAYQKFVERPTGVVGKLTEHESYRLCLSHPIDIGPSWQLPVYLAHWLKHQGLLYESLRSAVKEGPHAIIWATGEVNYHLQINPVGGLDRKLSHFIRWLAQNIDQSIPILVVVPQDAAGMVRARLDELSSDSTDIHIVALEHIAEPQRVIHDFLPQQKSVDAGDITEISRPGVVEPLNLSENSGIIRYKSGILVALALLSLLLITYFVIDFRLSLALPRLDQINIFSNASPSPTLTNLITLEILVERRTEKRSCFSMVEARLPFRVNRQIINHPIPEVLNLWADESACRFTLEIHNRGTEDFSALLIPATDSTSVKHIEGVLPLLSGSSRTAVLLDRTKLGGMRITTGPTMRLYLTPMATDSLKRTLTDRLIQGGPSTSAIDHGSTIPTVWMRDIQATVDNRQKSPTIVRINSDTKTQSPNLSYSSGHSDEDDSE